MSEVSSRSKVHSISCTQIVASAGVALIGTVLAAVWEGFRDKSHADTCQPSCRSSKLSRQDPQTLESLQALQARRVQLEQKVLKELQHRKGDPLEYLKSSTLQSFKGTNYVVNRKEIEPLLHGLISAQDMAAANRARMALIVATSKQHMHFLQHSLTVACRNAAIKVGFNQIEVVEGPLGCIRIIAMNPEGKALVTELDAGNSARTPRIETEVVGSCDNSCVSLLDSFDRALEEEGVRSAPPDRRHTGGVCELAAARAFVQRRVKRVHSNPPESATNCDIRDEQTRAMRRAQQLNRREVVKRH